MNEEREEKAKTAVREAEMLGRELRYAQQTVAGELAGWRDMHEKMGRRAIKELARGMLILEKGRMEGLKRALRKVKGVDVSGLRERSSVLEVNGVAVGGSSSSRINGGNGNGNANGNGNGNGKGLVPGKGAVGVGKAPATIAASTVVATGRPVEEENLMLGSSGGVNGGTSSDDHGLGGGPSTLE